MPRAKAAPHTDVCALDLIAQAESFATALQLMALALDWIPKEQAGAIAANATEIVARMESLRAVLRAHS
jgi:hypothetical protein